MIHWDYRGILRSGFSNPDLRYVTGTDWLFWFDSWHRTRYILSEFPEICLAILHLLHNGSTMPCFRLTHFGETRSFSHKTVMFLIRFTEFMIKRYKIGELHWSSPGRLRCECVCVCMCVCVCVHVRVLASVDIHQSWTPLNSVAVHFMPGYQPMFCDFIKLAFEQISVL